MRNSNYGNFSNIISLGQNPDNIKYNLDANAGLPIKHDDLAYYINIETSINNINGWSQEKMSIKEQYLLVKDKLLKTFVNENNEQQYSNLYYAFSVGEALKIIYSSILDRKENMFIYPNQHPHISAITSSLQKCHRLQNFKANTCLVNLLTSQTNEDQSAQLKDAENKNYLYTIADASQALGRLNLKQLNHMIDCLILSPRKVGGMSNLCFVFVTKQFEDKYLCNQLASNNFLPEQRFVSMMLSSARQVMDAFSVQTFNLETNKHQQKLIAQQLEQYDEYITIQPLDENVPQTHTALMIELDKKLCPRLFQQELAKRGIAVGFETACQSDTSNKIRLSWREIYDNIDITQEVAQAIEACENDAENDSSQQDQQGLQRGQFSQHSMKGGYKLKLQQDRQHDPKQGARNLSMYNRRLFYLRGHWVPLNTDDNKAVRYKIPTKYAVMFQNFVLQQRQDYYLYIPELKQEFKEWLQAKQEENYKLENPHKKYNSRESKTESKIENEQTQKQTQNQQEDSDETPLEAFEYLYRVSKHIYLTPSPDEHSHNTLTLQDFDFDEKASRYTQLPDDFVQLFQNVSPKNVSSKNENEHDSNNSEDSQENTNDKNTLYPMTYTKYKRCLKDEIDLHKEYINNPSSEFVIKMKLPIQEHFINSGNSYVHSISKYLVYKPQEEPKRMYPTVKERLEQVNSKYVQVIQPGRQHLNETAIELTKEIIKDNDKTKIVLIIHNPTIEQQEEIFKQGFEEVRQKILSYQNWYQQWYFDDNIYTYTRNLKK